MTIKECIDIVDNIKPNQYTVADKVRWLSFHDMGIINDVLKTHEGYDGRYDLFDGYTEDKLSVTLIVPSPYDKLYPEYLKMKIDGENGETAKYNNSAALYNSYLMDYRKWYNKTHMPIDATYRGYRYEAPKKHTVGLTAAEYENLKRDLYYALSADMNEAVSPDKLYNIVTSYAYNNIEMLKGADGKTPVRGVDYYTEEDVNALVVEVQKVQNESLAKAYADIAKADEVLRLHMANKDNPHGVTAKQVGAYTFAEVDALLDEKVSASEVYEERSFGWTKFEYTADENAYADIQDNIISAGSSYPITIHCKGKVIGFTASSDGSYYRLKVNGKNVLENTSWSTVSQTYTLPPTLMTEDIVVELSVSQIDFTDMTIQNIKGIAELEEAIDRILAVQNRFIGGDL